MKSALHKYIKHYSFLHNILSFLFAYLQSPVLKMSSTENEMNAALADPKDTPVFSPQTPPGTPPAQQSLDEDEQYDVISTAPEVETVRLIGQVKWFNNKAGYGFITCHTEEQDIFAHYSTIDAPTAQYKYLVLGEYVEFTKSKSVNEKHEFQAMHITGITGGKLMCETRHMNRMYQQQYQQQRQHPESVEQPTEDKRRTSRPSPSNRTTRGPPPPTKRRNDTSNDETNADADGFETVQGRKRPNKKRSVQPTIST